MALITKLSTLKVINPEGDRIILNDSTGIYGETIYTETGIEGEYTSRVNDTGYGAPNLSRNEVANFVIGVIRKVDGDVPVKLELYSALSSTEYKAIAPEDGVYSFNMITVPIVDYISSIAIGDAGYIVADNKIYQKLADGTSIVVEPEDLLGTKYSSATVTQLFVANISLKKIEVNEYLTNLRKNDSSINRPKITRAQDQYNTIRCLLTGAIYLYCKGDNYPAQENVEYLNKYIIDINYGL